MGYATLHVQKVSHISWHLCPQKLFLKFRVQVHDAMRKGMKQPDLPHKIPVERKVTLPGELGTASNEVLDGCKQIESEVRSSERSARTISKTQMRTESTASRRKGVEITENVQTELTLKTCKRAQQQYQIKVDHNALKPSTTATKRHTGPSQTNCTRSRSAKSENVYKRCPNPKRFAEHVPDSMTFAVSEVAVNRKVDQHKYWSDVNSTFCRPAIARLTRIERGYATEQQYRTDCHMVTAPRFAAFPPRAVKDSSNRDDESSADSHGIDSSQGIWHMTEEISSQNQKSSARFESFASGFSVGKSPMLVLAPEPWRLGACLQLECDDSRLLAGVAHPSSLDLAVDCVALAARPDSTDPIVLDNYRRWCRQANLVGGKIGFECQSQSSDQNGPHPVKLNEAVLGVTGQERDSLLWPQSLDICSGSRPVHPHAASSQHLDSPRKVVARTIVWAPDGADSNLIADNRFDDGLSPPSLFAAPAACCATSHANQSAARGDPLPSHICLPQPTASKPRLEERLAIAAAGTGSRLGEGHIQRHLTRDAARALLSVSIQD